MIGILGSGTFGLSIFKLLRVAHPNCSMIYFGDTEAFPFDSKSQEFIIARTRMGINFLIEQGVTSVFIVSHTISSIAYSNLEATITCPIGSIHTSMVKDAIANSKNLRFGVLGTRTLMESGLYEKMIFELAPDSRSYASPCPLLFSLIEEGWMKVRETRMIVKKYIYPLKVKQIDTLILASSVLTLMKDLIQEKAGRRIRVIGSDEGAVTAFKDFLERTAMSEYRLMNAETESRVYLSDVNCHTLSMAERFYGEKIRVERGKIV